MVTILFVADIFGRPGRRAASQLIPALREEYGVHFCVANGENAAGGFGLTEKIVGKIYSYGVDVITTGNHIWDRKEIMDYLPGDHRLLRPANYPDGVPGRGSVVLPLTDGGFIGVINLQGRVYMPDIDCPFRTASREVSWMTERTRVIIVDMHAEATSEKRAMGWWLDGHVSAVIGTHTHIQTADEAILPKGTAYITDVGMTGPHDSVIGVTKEVVIQRFLTRIPRRFETAREGIRLDGAVISIDEKSGRALEIRRLAVDCPVTGEDVDG